MNFWEKSENVMFLHSLRLSFMQKIRKIYRAVLRENLVRQRERQTDRDGPEYKGPPDAIAKPSDQKLKLSVINLQKTGFLAKMAIFHIFWQKNP